MSLNVVDTHKHSDLYKFEKYIVSKFNDHQIQLDTIANSSTATNAFANIVNDISSLPSSAQVGAVYVVNDGTVGHLYYWNGTNWIQLSGTGSSSGGSGGGTITNVVNNITNISQVPAGATKGDVSVINGSMYYWDGTQWLPVSSNTVNNYTTIQQLPTTGNTTGSVSMVNGSLYYWDGNDWKPVNSSGSITYNNTYTTVQQLPTTGVSTGTVSMVGDSLYYWDGSKWEPVSTTTINNYTSTTNLPATGNTDGSVSMVNGSLYYWDATANTWKPISSSGGTTIINYNSTADLPKTNTATGTVSMVNGSLYYWDGTSWKPINTNSINNYTDTTSLPKTNNIDGTVAMVNGSLYYWNGTSGAWEPVISNGGTTVINNYTNTTSLPNTASAGSVSMVDGVLYYWDTSTNSWKPVANGNVINNVYNNSALLPSTGAYQGQVAVAGNTLYYWDGTKWESIGGGLQTGTLKVSDPFSTPTATVNGNSLDLTFPAYPKYGYMYHSDNQSITISKGSSYHTTLHKLSFGTQVVNTFPSTGYLTVNTNSEFTITNGVYQIAYYIIYDVPSDITADDLVIDFRVSADTSIDIDTATIFHDVSAFTQNINGQNKAIFIANRTIPTYNTSLKFAFYLSPDSNGKSTSVDKDIQLTNGKQVLYIAQQY
jgi:hypothetical protein